MRADPRRCASIMAWHTTMSAGRQVYCKTSRVSTSPVRHTPRDWPGPGQPYSPHGKGAHAVQNKRAVSSAKVNIFLCASCH